MGGSIAGAGIDIYGFLEITYLHSVDGDYDFDVEMIGCSDGHGLRWFYCFVQGVVGRLLFILRRTAPFIVAVGDEWRSPDGLW